MDTVLPLTYLGNIYWFSRYMTGSCVIDVHENYVRQSWRNRCRILTANGVVPMTVHVRGSNSGIKVPVREMKIDYSKRWLHQHWQTLVSAYASSPYFEHYRDRFERVYRTSPVFLMDWNAALLEVVTDILKGPVPRFSECYIEPAGLTARGIADLRQGEAVTGVAWAANDRNGTPGPIIDTGRSTQGFVPVPYWQVFSDRFDFQPNLSVIDLLFCEGPHARDIINRSAT